MAGFHFVAFALVLFIGYIRITPGPNRELAVPHKFELAAFKRTADQLQNLLSADKFPPYLSGLYTRLTDAAKLSSTVGTIFLLTLLLDYRVGTWIVVVVEVMFGATQELTSWHFGLSVGFALIMVILVSFPQFPFRAQDVSQQLRRQLDEELAALQADIVDQIEASRSVLKLGKRKQQ